MKTISHQATRPLAVDHSPGMNLSLMDTTATSLVEKNETDLWPDSHKETKVTNSRKEAEIENPLEDLEKKLQFLQNAIAEWDMDII